jgi:hypothetical protein
VVLVMVMLSGEINATATKLKKWARALSENINRGETQRPYCNALRH